MRWLCRWVKVMTSQGLTKGERKELAPAKLPSDLHTRAVSTGTTPHPQIRKYSISKKRFRSKAKLSAL